MYLFARWTQPESKYVNFVEQNAKKQDEFILAYLTGGRTADNFIYKSTPRMQAG